MPPDVEVSADAALVRIMFQGETRGTGFIISEDGAVLTCHHVIDGLPSLQLRGPDGSTYEVDRAAITVAPEIDLALISVASAIGKPLPVVNEVALNTEFWTKGYHRLSAAIRAAYPVGGRITGRTSVSYTGDTFEYDINDVFVLHGGSIDHGLSGAPVINPESGAVVAVVSTKFIRTNEDGFAIPIAYAAEHHALREAVSHNQATIAAYGAYLNAPAARALCKSVTESELDKLTQLSNVDLNRHVPRDGIATSVGRFLSGDVRILALIGPSGVGKSTEIAAIAQQLPGRALLLRGSSLPADSTAGLGEAILAALNGARGGQPLPDNADTAIARALPADRGLVVLLDALNEAPLSGRAFKEWIANTRSWLRTTPAQVIISCRSELWADLIGQILPDSRDDREGVVVTLGVFTTEEYRAAANVYGLPMDPDWPILRLPLALRLSTRYQEKSTPLLGALTSINDVIKNYLDETARNLAASGPAPPLSAQLMLDRLAEVAALMLERGTDVVDLRSLGKIFGGASIVDALIAEGVMNYTPPSEYRFVYDDVGDWLQAQRLDVDDELAAILAGPGRSWRRVGLVASALREVGRLHGSDAMRAVLARLVGNSGGASDLAFQIAAVTLAKVADSEPFMDILHHMAGITVNGAGSVNYYFNYNDDVTEFWRSVSLPAVQRLDLLRRLCLCDNYFPWRPKDWAPQLAAWLDSSPVADSRYGAIAYALVRQDPTAGIPALLPWLDDETPLADDSSASAEGGIRLGVGEATVAHVAMGILYLLRTEQERLVWAAIKTAGERCRELISRLGDGDPRFLARMIIEEQNTEDSDELVISAAGSISGRSLPTEIMQSVCDAIRNRYLRGLGHELLGPALNVLISGPDGQNYVQAVVAAYQAKVPRVTEDTLAMAVARDPGEIVVPVLAAVLAQGGSPKNQALFVLGFSRDLKTQAVADRIVRHYLENGIGDVDSDVSGYAEGRITQGNLGEDALAVIQRVIDAPAGSGRHVLAYVLTSFDPGGDARQRLALLRKFVDATTDGRSASLTADKLIDSLGRGEFPAEVPELLLQTLGRLDSSESDRIIMVEAYSHAEFAELLASWLTTKKMSAPGDSTRQFQARIEAGESPASVAREVAYEAFRYRLGEATEMEQAPGRQIPGRRQLAPNWPRPGLLAGP
jgi:S1-C subfamily serine protease